MYKTIQPPCGRWKCPLGAVRYQRGESHRRWLITVMLFMSYDTESKSRNADFKNCGEAATTTLGPQGPVKLKNPWAAGRSILRTFPLNPLNPHAVGVSNGAAGKGEASAASQSAECFSCHMTLKANPVTLTLYALPQSGNPQPSGPKAPSNLRTLRPERAGQS